MIGVTELIIIILAGAIIFGGGNKIAEIARALGKFSVEFKKGKAEAERELKELEKEIKDENRPK